MFNKMTSYHSSTARERGHKKKLVKKEDKAYVFPWETFDFNQKQLTERIKSELKTMDVIDGRPFVISKSGRVIRCCTCGANAVIQKNQNLVICSYNSMSKSGAPNYALNEFYNCSNICDQYVEKIEPEMKKRIEHIKKKKEEAEFEARFQKEKRYQEYKAKHSETTCPEIIVTNQSPQIIHHHTINNIVGQIGHLNGNVFSK